MGPGAEPNPKDIEDAHELGRLIAKQEWVLLTGGRDAGVMDAASRGASGEGGLTVGILPGEHRDEMSDFIDIPIATGMGSARNNINVLSSDVIVACGTGAGTLSEIMLGLKAGKQIILINQSKETVELLKDLAPGQVRIAASPQEAIDAIHSIL